MSNSTEVTESLQRIRETQLHSQNCTMS